MEIVHFIYNNQEVEFIPAGDGNLLVNATQMAKIFKKDVRIFLKADHVNAFIEALLLTPYGVNKLFLTRAEIVSTNKKGGTWMHRTLALKFAAWLDPYFEVWVFHTVDKIILGHYADVKEATIEKLKAEKELADKKELLILNNPELAEIFELELKVSATNRKRLKALNATVDQLKIDLFDN